MPLTIGAFGREYAKPDVRDPKLCCLVKPLVACVECLTPCCEECANDEYPVYHRIPCEGGWFPMHHEAIAKNRETRRMYIPRKRLPLPHKRTDGKYVQ